MKTLRIFLQFLFVVANVVAVVLLIVSAYSDRVSPETSMTLSGISLSCRMCSQSLLYYLLAVLMGMEVLIDRHILLLVMLGSRETLFSVSLA